MKLCTNRFLSCTSAYTKMGAEDIDHAVDITEVGAVVVSAGLCFLLDVAEG